MKASKATIMKAIKAKCLDCCGWEKREISKCTVKTCALYNFRLGKTDIETNETKVEKVRKPMSEEHKAALKAGREAAKLKKGN